MAVTTLIKAPLPVGDLPAEKDLVTAEPSLVFDASGRQIGLFRGFDQSQEIDPGEVPQVLKDAVVAIEDQRFWDHDGVDYEGIARAARTNLEVGGVAQGGSTITQQYVKNIYLSNEQTLERKVQEALLAVEIEKRLTKEEILFGYLTSSYYGYGAYGIGAAAEIYFDKSVSELDISEAATLAGVVKAPSRLSPYVDREAGEAPAPAGAPGHARPGDDRRGGARAPGPAPALVTSRAASRADRSPPSCPGPTRGRSTIPTSSTTSRPSCSTASAQTSSTTAG